jgi:tetratricopeptide (TPR) repeat protein
MNGTLQKVPFTWRFVVHMKQTLGGLLRMFLLVSFFLLSSTAMAQPKPIDPAKRTQAKEKFLTAEKEYKAGRYGNALGEYYEAFVLSGEPLLLYNMGQCYRNLGRYAEAVDTYKDFVERAPETPFTPKAEKWITELAPKVEPKPIEANTQPASSQPDTNPSTEPSSSQSAPTSVPTNEILMPDAVSLQKDQLRLDLSDEELGLKKAKRWFKFGGAWVGGGLALGGLTVVSMLDTKRAQKDVDRPVEDIKARRNRSVALGIAGDASCIVGGLYIWKAFSLLSKEKTAQIEFASLSGGGAFSVSLSW